MLLEGISKAVDVTCQVQSVGCGEGQRVTILMLYSPLCIHFLSISNIPPNFQPCYFSILFLGRTKCFPFFQYHIYFPQIKNKIILKNWRFDVQSSNYSVVVVFKYIYIPYFNLLYLLNFYPYQYFQT